MVRISEDGSRDGHRVVKLEGSVTGPSVSHVGSYCQNLLSQKIPLLIDMGEVLFLDRNAITLFKDLLCQGVRLSNCSPFLKELLTPTAPEIR